MPKPPKYTFHVESMVASRTGDPGVIVTVNGADFAVNMTPDSARELATNIFRAAEAADSDAFVFSFFRDEVGLSREDAGAMLHQFREHREKARKE